MGDEMGLVRTLLKDAGLELQDVPDRRGVLGEDRLRIVWTVLFETPQALLEGWEQEQAWLVELTNSAEISVEKSWDLYLVLGAIQSANIYILPALDKIRRNVSLTRKIVVPGVGASQPSRIASLLAPLRPLPPHETSFALDALTIIERDASGEGRTDVLEVLEAYRENAPLLGEAPK